MELDNFYEQLSDNISQFNKYVETGKMEDYDAYAYEFESICKGFLETYIHKDNITEANTEIIYQYGDNSPSGFETKFEYYDGEDRRINFICLPNDDKGKSLVVEYTHNITDENDFNDKAPYDISLLIDETGVIQLDARTEVFEALQDKLDISDVSYDGYRDSYTMDLEESYEDIAFILSLFDEIDIDNVTDDNLDDWNDPID